MICSMESPAWVCEVGSRSTQPTFQSAWNVFEQMKMDPLLQHFTAINRNFIYKYQDSVIKISMNRTLRDSATLYNSPACCVDTCSAVHNSPSVDPCSAVLNSPAHYSVDPCSAAHNSPAHYSVDLCSAVHNSSAQKPQSQRGL